jgi:MFS family permease
MDKAIVYPPFRWLVLASACLAYIGLCTMMGLPPVLPDVAKSLGITMAAANDLLFAPILLASLSLIFVSGFADRYGIMPSLLLALLFNIIPSMLMPLIGKTYMIVLILRAAVGVSAGFGFCVMSSVIGTWFPLKEKGLAAGIMGTSVSVGMLGVVVAPFIAQSTGGWQQMVAWLTVPAWIGLLVTLIGWARQPKPPVQMHGGEQADSSAFKKALASPVTWIGVLVTFFAAWVMQCLFNVTPVYLAAENPIGLGFGSAQAGALMLPLTIAALIAPIVAGLLQDKVFHGNSKPVMLLGFVLTTIFVYCMLVPAVYTNKPLLVTSLVLAGAGFQLTYTLVAVYISRFYPLSIAGKMTGLWMGLGMFGGVVGVGLARPLLAHTGSYYTAMLMTALAGAAGIILTSFLKKLKAHEEAATGGRTAA